MINSQGIVKIADFGLAISLKDKDKAGKFAIEGFTTWYKPPEVLFGSRTYDTSFDIWSFGCLFGEMLNGAPLFPGSNDLHQVSKISEYLGSPTPENWPSIVDLPDYDKIIFESKAPLDLGSVFPDASKSEVQLLTKALRYDQRATAESLLNSPYFTEYPPKLQKLMPEDKRIKVQVKKYEEIFNIIG